MKMSTAMGVIIILLLIANIIAMVFFILIHAPFF